MLDNNTSFRHPLLGFLDGFAIKAAEVTNEWFFDVVMTAVYDLKPINLENTFVTVPKTDGERLSSSPKPQPLKSRGFDLSPQTHSEFDNQLNYAV